MQDVTGKTAMILMLANPVGHIRGTVLINQALQDLGLDAAIVPIDVAPKDLGGVLGAARCMKNLAGLGITIPHKIAVLDLLDAVTDEARRAGAVNFVRRDPDGTLTGTNTDGAGFVAGLSRNGVSLAGKSVVMAGTGGVARAIGFSLAGAGVRSLVILGRNPDKAAALARDIGAISRQCHVTGAAHANEATRNDADILVNATSLGMAEIDALPLAAEDFAQATIAADVVVNPAMTRFLQAAAARGCKVITGAEMLKPQPALFAAFFGLRPMNP